MSDTDSLLLCHICVKGKLQRMSTTDYLQTVGSSCDKMGVKPFVSLRSVAHFMIIRPANITLLPVDYICRCMPAFREQPILPTGISKNLM